MSSAEMRALLAALPSQDLGVGGFSSAESARLSPALPAVKCVKVQVGSWTSERARACAPILASRFQTGACRVFRSVLSCTRRPSS